MRWLARGRRPRRTSFSPGLACGCGWRPPGWRSVAATRPGSARGKRGRGLGAAAGEPVRGGYALGLDQEKDVAVIDAALVRAGLAGRVPGDGRRYVISGRRRVARLAELVGERPPAAPAEVWPGGA